RRPSTAKRRRGPRASSRESSSCRWAPPPRPGCAASSTRRRSGGGVRTRPLRETGARELRPLLDEEAALWHSEPGWDFAEVRAAVSGGIERGSLPGRVVAEGGRAVAYCYYMVDPARVIVGSIFATRGLRGRGIEEELVDAVIEDARAERGSGRVECQTLFCTA